MSVYVDDFKGQFGRMVMCHMMADTLDELHSFARRLGLRRSWFQAKSGAHYDICKAKRSEALSLGAIHLPIVLPDGKRNRKWLEVYNMSKQQLRLLANSEEQA